MFPILINPLPLLLSLTTSFGVLVHDTNIDRAASIAISMPIAFAIVGTADSTFKFSDQHTHTERTSYTNAIKQMGPEQPRTQTRGGDDKKYIFNKKFTTNTGGSEYHWPSV